MSEKWQELVKMASAEAERLMNRLPPPLREPARAIPVVFEGRPGQDRVVEGIEPDTMGLFEGPSRMDPEGGVVEIPPQITLFLNNIWEEAGADEARFREEVRITLLHELGHYLGYGEGELSERDLE